MKIIINKTKRLLFVGGTMLKPGTNIVDDDFDENNKDVKAWKKAKFVSVKDTKKMSDDDLEEAISLAYDNGVVDKLEKLSKSKDVKDAADKQKGENAKKEKELDDAIKEAEKAKDGKKE